MSKAFRITLPVTPYKATPARIRRMRDLYVPQCIIDKAEAREESRTDMVREHITWTCNKSIRWERAYTTFEGETEILFLSFSGKKPVRVDVTLSELVKEGIITSYDVCAFPPANNGAVAA